MNRAEQLIKICPSGRQLAFQKLEFYAFIHFGMNTFADKEWGEAFYDLRVFNPTEFDAAQWVGVVKSAGMSALILTCKHHDGFCLWDTCLTDYQVMNTPFRRDLTAEVARECEKQGIRFGIYLSPWDKHHSSYGKGKEYDDYYVGQLEELLTRYGDIFSVWMDGACGEGENGLVQRYDWRRYYSTVRRLQPNAVISVTGPDVRWCGNEAGVCRSSEYAVVPARLSDPDSIAGNSQQKNDTEFRERMISRKDMDLGSREVLKDELDLIWYPAEVDTSIRPGWFYHPDEDNMVKSLEKLWVIYCSSVGGNATLLLNVPPAPNGLIHPLDLQRLAELGSKIRMTFRQNLMCNAQVTASVQEKEHPAENIRTEDECYFKAPDGYEAVELTILLDKPCFVEYAILMEQIAKSQRIEEFELWAGGRSIYQGTTVGYKKICRFSPVRTQCFTVKIIRSRVAPTLKMIGLYEAQDWEHESK